MKPLIGITVDCKQDPEDARRRGLLTLNWNYAQTVADSGGVPLLIPPMADMATIAEILDGWLIPGGNDIDASHFGEQNHAKVELQDPARYEAEHRLLDRLPPDVPVLGICYGCQFLNVARGGTLIQHLPDLVGHERHSGGTLEPIRLGASALQDAVGSEVIQGKSYHHQAVKELGENLRIVARAEDGTVEAVEATDRPWMIGVQWHPERTAEDAASRRLFENFIAAAKQYAARRLMAAAS